MTQIQQNNTIPKGYKSTEIGIIPEDWEFINVGDLLKFKNGLNKEKEFFGYGTPIINYMDVYSSPDIKKVDIKGKVSLSLDESNNYSAKVGDVFFTRTSETPNEIGISAVLVENINKCVFSGFVLRGRPKTKKLDTQFSKYCFRENNIRRQIISTCSYTTRALTNGRLLSDIKIPLPPTIQEQQAIAQVLSDTDRCIESIAKLITKKKAIKQGAMQELLTGKKRLAGFDGEWETKKLGEVADINMGQSPLSMFYNNEGNGLPLIQGNADVKNRRTIIRSYTSYWPKNANKGDIIMTVRAPVGKIAKASFNCCIGRGVCSIIYKNDYLFFYLIFKENSWSKISTGSTFDSINSNQIKEVEINLPKDTKEQQAIAQILSDMDAEIEALTAQLHKTKALKQGLMQKLLTGKTRLVNPKTYNEQDLKLNTAAEP